MMTDPSRICIINVAIGSWHPQGQVRLRASLEKVGYDGGLLFYNDTYPDGSPSHKESPYAFKPYAFKEAFELGYEIALYVDASVWANKDVMPIIKKIEKDGYFFPLNGWTVGNWSTDSALRYFGLTRDEAMNIKLMIAGIMGIDFRSETAYKYYHRWLSSVPSFAGAWTNENKQCSQDVRCYGHRHDQTAASVIAHNLGMVLTEPQGWLDYNVENKESILLLRGM